MKKNKIIKRCIRIGTIVAFITAMFKPATASNIDAEIDNSDSISKLPISVGALSDVVNYSLDDSIVIEHDDQEIVASSTEAAIVEDTEDTEEIEEEPEEVWVYPNEDVELFASVIYYEAGACNYKCKLMIASSVANCVESNANGFQNLHTIGSVLSNHRKKKNGKTVWQYSVYKKAKRTRKYDEECYEIATLVLKNGSYDKKPLFFRNGKENGKPKIIKNTTFYKTIDGVNFSY